MPLLHNVLLCALSALILSGCVGLPLAYKLVPQRSLARAIAPALGWAVFSALTLPVLTWVGFARATVALVCGTTLLGGIAALLWCRFRGTAARVDSADVPGWAYGGAALLAVVPALGAWPKLSGGGVALTESMFDHSKVAIIDDIVRLGLPPGNPFFGAVGAAPGLAYYYLWHFSAAIFSAALGANGWEADIALTWFTSFASLTLMMGFAVWLSGRQFAALWVLALSLAASLRPVLAFALPPDFLWQALSQYQGPHSWIFQASWVPQHLASASCVVLAVYLLSRLATPRSWPLVPALAVVVAAGFESSTWIGGIIFAAAAVPIGLAQLLSAVGAGHRLRFLAQATLAVMLVAAISFPFLRDEYAATAARHVGPAIAFAPFQVLGPIVPDGIRRALDLPAYWGILLLIEFPAIYPAGAAALVSALAGRLTLRGERRLVVGFAVLAGASFGVVWLFASTIANNDLGWRGVLPGILVLTIFAAVGLSRWVATGPRFAMAAAVAALALGIPDGLGIVAENAIGTTMPDAATLAETPALWAAVRRHTAPSERIGNNPLFLDDAVRWPVNISWALLANRRSCYASWNLARAYVALPGPEIERINALFERVFGGGGTAQDVEELATRYDCRVIVVVPSDGAWRRDPFAASPLYRLVEANSEKWRIYRVVETASDQP